MAKFSYNNVATLLFCAFLVASMVSGAVAQETCHDVLPAPGGGNCDPQTCKDECVAKWGGNAAGLCVQSFVNLYSCNCSWPCSRKN
ncbi:DNAse I-like superfamily protein isoform 1 [Hibiscus syriacus]|uniref:DNAse I-like superfamily protein isoform 1 n=1 Tax=Hibiscus syriacus TaxID=106335 RepID=A0A6A2XWB1_HIBSY|nr:DNAse I-like superfamily protein isoform 1 [Hibiscus syriacus]